MGNASFYVTSSEDTVGIDWKGTWVTSTVYALNDAVYESTNGQSYLCVVAHTSGTFSTDLTSVYWELMVQKGADGANGTGVGDVVGPASATDNALAQFDGTTGELLKDGPSIGVATTDIATVNQADTATASATSTTLGTTLKHTISGTTTITSFSGVAGVTYHVTASGAFLLTHHATNLDILQTGASITTAVDDTFDVYMRTTTTAEIRNYALAINSLVEDTSPVEGDFLVSYDTSASANKKIDLKNIPTSVIGSPTVSTLRGTLNAFHSSGWVSGGLVVDVGAGQITVAAGEGFIKASESTDGSVDLKTFAWSALTATSLTDANINYIYIDYNAGSPVVTISTTEPTEIDTKILLSKAYRDGTIIHLNNSVKHAVSDHAGQMIQRLKATASFAHESGGILSETGTRNVAVTAGTFWEGLTQFSTSALDTSADSTFSSWYRDGGGGWTQVASQTQIDNTQYDDGSGTLATLANSKYGVHWVYLATNDDLNVVYGTGSYSLIDAQASTTPSALPPHVSVDSRLIGRIIIAKSASVFISAESSFTGAGFSGGSATSHSELTGLQGGTTDDYYHLTLAQHTNALAGDTIGQHTIFVPAGAMEAAVTTAPATSNAVEIGTSLFAARTMDFATDADDFAYFGIQMPKSWDAGTLVLQYIWSATGTTANTVMWSAAAVCLADDEVLTTAFPAATPLGAADTNSVTADDIMVSAEVSITVAGTPVAEGYVMFEISRTVASDTLAEDARLHGIRVHYTVDTGNDT